MSDFYILAFLQGDAPLVDVDAIDKELKANWNILDIQKRNDHTQDVLTWDMNINGVVVTGYVDNSRKSLTLDGGIHPIAKFVVWYRQWVKNDVVLSFFEQSYEHGLLEIDFTTTEDEIIEAFNT